MALNSLFCADVPLKQLLSLTEYFEFDLSWICVEVLGTVLKIMDINIFYSILNVFYIYALNILTITNHHSFWRCDTEGRGDAT